MFSFSSTHHGRGLLGAKLKSLSFTLFRPLLLAKLCQILLLKIWVDMSAEQVGWWEMDLSDEDWSKNNLDNAEPKVFQLTVKADFTGKESCLMNLWGRASQARAAIHSCMKT